MTDKDIWHPLGEQEWRRLAEGTGASELQIRFSAARFGGASASGAAKLAGYSGDKDSLRRAGYTAVRSTAVQQLLELASIAAPTEAKISDKEIDAKISRLIRSGDPNVVLKAMDLHAKREQVLRERGESPTDDGFEDWRTCRDYLEMDNGATAFMAMYKAVRRNIGGPVNYPMLHDVYHLMQREPMGRAIWDWACSESSPESREDLERKLANPNYQAEARKRIWGEINRLPPGPLKAFTNGGVHAA